MLTKERLKMWYRYLRGRTPWDTGIVPPEIVQLVEQETLASGQAVDLGCGTGTTSTYLARHGWRVTGIDFVPQAIQRARHKAQQADVTERTQFIIGDLTRLERLPTTPPYDLAVDIGCGHALPTDAREGYARNLAGLLKPGAVFMLYAIAPQPGRNFGLTANDVDALFSPYFALTDSAVGIDRAAGSKKASWYRFTRR
jgi:cyclopropane fatty-acyl-phospholipid synthase-like methyltransferase